ncbi:MAG TPA: DnaJ domain-containing protein [Acidimicrobiales bacterium]|nr:DnaJ domain-containing protein [Acidimicrobiales bacterium]
MTSKHDADGNGLYHRLEVLPGASQDEVARAYRRLAHDAHPDAHPGDPDAPRRFREITEAFEVLGDPARRARYDRGHDQGHDQDRVTGTSRVRPGNPSAAPPEVFAPPPPPAGGPPVFLGTGPVSRPGATLSVGPVHVRPTRPGPPASVTPEEVRAALWAQLLSDLFEPRRRP